MKDKTRELVSEVEAAGLAGCHAAAKRKNGKFLSQRYINKSTKYLWKCSKGHQWSANFSNISAGKWCSHCAGNKKGSLKNLVDIAAKKNGLCLSVDYLGASHRHKYKWECQFGHQWEAQLGNIKAGKWCPTCNQGKQRTIQDMIQIAKKNGGDCLSKDFVAMSKKLKWICKKGHVWEAVPASIIYNESWCAECAGRGKKTINEMHSLAQQNGGKCLSEKYTNTSTKMKWICIDGHEWEATPRDISTGRWCPTCAKSFFFREEICRLTLETVFGVKFPKSYPDWLRTDEGSKLELDGFSKKLGIAFEYDGEQHFKKNFFSGNKKSLSKIQDRDQHKTNLCLTHKVFLLRFHYKQDVFNLKADIKKKLQKHPALISRANFKLKINFESIRQTKSRLKELHLLAKEKGGECLSKIYKGNSEKILWRCDAGHEFLARPFNVKSGHWCPTCGGRPQLSVLDMQKLAMERGGACLSINYKNVKGKLKWECEYGHKWSASYRKIKAGSWCKQCERDSGNPYYNQFNINDCIAFASKKNGYCLSKSYKNSTEKMSWRCEKGHIWDATFGSIRTDRWCPACGGRPKLNLQDAMKAAIINNGECLSKSYINVKIPLIWKCEKNHVWKSSFDSVRQGNWCRSCAQTRRREREKANKE